MHRHLLLVALALLGAPSLLAATSLPTAPGSPAASGEMMLPPQVLLRMEEVGGFAPLHALLTRVPTFTLYADGLVIYRSHADPDVEDPGSVPLSTTLLPPEDTASLLEFALAEGGLAEARADYQVGGIADATTTVFTVGTEDGTKSVSVYALGIGDADGRDERAYRRFLRLAETLADFDAWLPRDAVVSRYEPAAYRALFVEDDPEQAGLLAWPWADIAPTVLVPVNDAPALLQTDLTPEQVALLTPVPSGGISGVAIAAPDGSAAWRLSVKPLLPDEHMFLHGDPAAEDDQAYEVSE